MTPLMEPPPEGDDDPFIGLEGLFDEVDVTEVIDVTKLNDQALLDHFHHITRQIQDRREVRTPRTAEGRELHSLRAAMAVELHQRGILG